MSFVAQGLSTNGWPGLALLRKPRGELQSSPGEVPGCLRSVGNPAVWNKGPYKYHSNCSCSLCSLYLVGMVSSGLTQLVTDFIFVYTQGLLGRNPMLFAKFLAFIHFSVKSEHTDWRLCRAHRATCWYLCVSSWVSVRLAGLVFMHIFPFLLPLPAAPSDIAVWSWIWEPPGKQSL